MCFGSCPAFPRAPWAHDGLQSRLLAQVNGGGYRFPLPWFSSLAVALPGRQEIGGAKVGTTAGIAALGQRQGYP